jgi:hypothetical protein
MQEINRTGQRKAQLLVGKTVPRLAAREKPNGFDHARGVVAQSAAELRSTSFSAAELMQ